MNLYEDYIKEREGALIIKEEWGFIEYRITPPALRIEAIYIRPEDRKSGKGSELADRVTQIAKEQNCTLLWAQVWASALNATESLKAILAYGFIVQRAENGVIILTKDIKE